MEIDSAKLAELRVKHLEMLQTVIGRMSNHSATLKNYCITLTTAVCGLAATLEKPTVALMALVPITIFGLLDANYLRLERRFRSEYDSVRNLDWGTRPDFAINGKGAVWSPFTFAVFSWSILIFYLPLAAIVIAVWAYIAGKL